MSADPSESPEQGTSNDVELRELVYQSLERDGTIARIRAELRAAVFKTIEKAAQSPATNGTSSNHETLNHRICRALVLDWLEQSRLFYTKDVFQMETSTVNPSVPLSDDELLEHLHLDSTRNRSQSILQSFIHQRSSSTRESSNTTINQLPEPIKQSIDARFPTEKINDLNRVREHFRSLFSSAFDSSLLDAFLQKSLPFTSMAKYDYEQLCLRWLQSCSKALNPPPSATPSPAPVNNLQTVTRARRALSPPSDSSSASSNTSENARQGQFDFTLPTIKKLSEVNPPKLENLRHVEDEEDDTSSSAIFSRKNATAADLNRLKNIEDIIQGAETPRTRTSVEKFSGPGNKDLPIEYDDDSVTHSQTTSIDDVTVDKASPSPSAQIDYLEDL